MLCDLLVSQCGGLVRGRAKTVTVRPMLNATALPSPRDHDIIIYHDGQYLLLFLPRFPRPFGHLHLNRFHPL